MAIDLKPVQQPLQTRTPVTSAQIESLITVIASANPLVITLPAGKEYTDVIRFVLQVGPNGTGMLDVTFK